MRRWVPWRPWVVLFLSLASAACSSKGRMAECDPAGAGRPSLLTNGSFEEPIVPAGGYSTYSNGETFPGWTVIGAPGNVAQVSASFAASGFTFSSEDGQQSIDMTGTNQNSATTGIQQTLPLTIGRSYCLAFWVGNVYDRGGPYGTVSTINVLIDGQTVAVDTNQDRDSPLSWEPFTATVVATGASTTIGFINGDPFGDSSNLLDNVTLR